MSNHTAADFFRALYGELRNGETIEIRSILKTGEPGVGQNRDIDADTAATSGETIEAPSIPKKNKPRAGRSYYSDIQTAANAVRFPSKKADVYFGVALRDGKGGAKENIVRISAVWVDLDAKEGLVEPLESVNAAVLRPSAMVCSGTGLHCYWFLEESVGPDGISVIEQLNRAIARALQGDTKATDASRILRAPGTLNLKGDEPKEVVLLGLEPGLRYSIEHLCDAFGAVESPTKDVTTAQRSTNSADRVCLPCRARMWRGVDQGVRNAVAFHLAIDLKRDGLPAKATLAALTDWNARNRPPLDPIELKETIRGVYIHDYSGLGCEKEPMAGWCSDDCRVKGVRGKQCTVDSGEGGKDLSSGTDNSQPTSDRSLRVWSASELAELGSEPPEFLVDGLVPARGVTMFTGEGGIGKSFVVLDLAFAVATGGRFVGNFECGRGPVVIVDLENEARLMGHRLRKIGAGRKCELGGLDVMVVRQDDASVGGMRIDTVDGRAAMEQLVAERKPRLLVIDPMVAIHGQDENSNVAMRQVMMTLDRLSQANAMAVVVVHHTRKRGEINDAGQRMRGASDLRNAVVSHVAFRRAGKSMISVEQDKCRPAERVQPFSIEMSDSEDGEAVCIRYAGEVESEAVLTKGDRARDFILNVLADDGECRRVDILARASADGINHRVVERKLADMVRTGEIRRLDRGLYAESGTAALPI